MDEQTVPSTSSRFVLESGVAIAAAMEGGKNFGTYLPARRGGSPATCTRLDATFCSMASTPQQGQAACDT